MEWRFAWQSELQGEERQALAVFPSAEPGGGTLLLPHLLDELAAAAAVAAAVGDDREEPADDLVAEGGCKTMLAPALAGIGTSAKNAEARGPRDIAEGNHGLLGMVGRWWSWDFPGALVGFSSQSAARQALGCQRWQCCKGSFGRLLGGMRR